MDVKNEDLEQGAWYKDGKTYSADTSSAISLKRIADALEQLVLFHLGDEKYFKG